MNSVGYSENLINIKRQHRTGYRPIVHGCPHIRLVLPFAVYDGLKAWVVNVSLCRRHLARKSKAPEERLTPSKPIRVARRSPFRGITDSQGTRFKTIMEGVLCTNTPE